MHARLALLAAALAAGPAPAQDKLSRPELAKKGKPAVVLVLADGGPVAGSGSGFVVHPGGLVVTANHVLNPGRRPAKGLKVVVNAGQPDQRVLDATAARTDAALDLALLRVTPAAPLPALEIGDSDSLGELQELVGFGFPFGARLGAGGDDLPAVTVTVHSVTALRKKAGTGLAAVQLDGAINPGHSGGPVLDAAGRVQGVIARGIGGAQTSEAVPANAVRKFLAAPDVSLTLPKVAPADAGKPAEFVAAAEFVLPAKAAPELTLTLDLGDGAPRTVPMAAAGGKFRATVVPAPPPAAVLVPVAAKFGAVQFTGPVADAAFVVGGKSVRLSAVREVRGPDGKVTLHDRTVLTGPVTGLDDVPVTMGGREVKLPLGRAESVTLTPPARPVSVACVVTARVGGVEVGRAEGRIALAAPAAPAAPGLADVRAADLGGDRVTRKLPEAFTEVCMGGGGRYLLFFLPKLSQVAAFDVSQAKVVHYFPAADPNAKVAAGMDAVVIALPAQGLLQRWNLKTRERELSVPLQDGGPVHSLLLGHASAGPLVVNGAYYDLAGLKPLAAKPKAAAFRRDLADAGTRGRVSADGSVVGVWSAGSSPSGLTSVTLKGGEAVQQYAHEDVGAVVPGPDGRYLFTAYGLFTRDLKPVGGANARANPWGVHLPAARGNLCVAVTPADPGTGSYHGSTDMVVTAFVAGDPRPLVKVATFKGDYEFNRWGREAVGAHNRFWLVPDAKAFVSLPASNDAVELTRFDLDDALAKSGVDYLFVASDPPAEATRGAAYTHQLDVRSKRGGVKCRLDAGPPGMTVTPDGRLDWPAPEPGKATAIIAVTDASGQEVFKTVVIAVKE